MSRRTQKNVGVVGLGIIGRRVAECLRRKGFHTFVWNRTPRPFPNFVGSPAEIAELCDFVQIFVSDDEALLEMVQQMKQSLNAHHIIMAHSTVAPHTMRAAAEIVQRRGAQLLDTPFTGSKNAAEKGELVYYVGGDDAAYRRARPVLEASSKEIIEIGEIGQATTIKIATNMVTAATVQVSAEALALVHNAGLPLEKFAAAMSGNGSNSGTLTMKLPKMIEGDFEPHFSVKHMLKDVEIASRLARAYGLVFGATEVARDTLREEDRRGRGDEDYSAMVRSFFPDGPPMNATEEPAQIEGQGTLSGLDEPTTDARADEAAVEVDKLEGQETVVAVVPVEEVIVAAEQAPNAEEEGATPEAVEVIAVETVPEQSDIVIRDGEQSESKTEPEVETVAAGKKAAPADEENGEPRGFFSRLFGKGTDY